MSKVDHYKVWIHVEGLNEDLRSKLVDIAGIIAGETK